MINSNFNFEDYSQEDFKFPGNYRAIVEDNQDPLKGGRVRVRIFGVHSLDKQETPTEHLPWAEPCLSLYHSGGVNLKNSREMASQGEKYKPDNQAEDTVPKRNNPELTEEFNDNIMELCGTGGHFTVPQKGNQVWIFFENGDHTRPHYWGMATKLEDWDSQKNFCYKKIFDKKDNIQFWRDEFDETLKGEDNQFQGKGVCSNAKYDKSGRIEIPKMELVDPDLFPPEHMTTYTSPGGVTHVITNWIGTEQHYIMHKSNIDYVEHNGQCKRMVGNWNFNGADEDQSSGGGENSGEGETGTPNDFQELIGNNYELHIGGDFDTFVRKSRNIYIDADAQINIRKQLSVVSREGNISIIVNKGDCNVAVNEGRTNVYSENDVQVETKANARVSVSENTYLDVGGSVYATVQGDMKSQVQGDSELSIRGQTKLQCASNVDVSANGNVSLQANGNMNFTSNGNMNFKCSKFSVTSDSTMDVLAGASFQVGGGGIGTDGNVSGVNIFGAHVGAGTDGAPAGSPSPVSATPVAAQPAQPIAQPPDPLQFASTSQTDFEDPVEPAFEENAKPDMPGVDTGDPQVRSRADSDRD